MYLPLDFQYQYHCPWISHHIGDWAKIYPGSFNTTIWTTDTKEKLEEEIRKPMRKESHNSFFWGITDISNSWRYMACSWEWQGVKAKIYQESKPLAAPIYAWGDFLISMTQVWKTDGLNSARLGILLSRCERRTWGKRVDTVRERQKWWNIKSKWLGKQIQKVGNRENKNLESGEPNGTKMNETCQRLCQESKVWI